jgi:hypothetical protein
LLGGSLLDGAKPNSRLHPSEDRRERAGSLVRTPQKMLHRDDIKMNLWLRELN